MTAELRPELPPLPDNMKKLPLDKRGYPIPWFVAELEDGTRDFRVADGEKRERIIRGANNCWVCGGTMGRYKAYVVGPMCSINKTSAEPPCHLACARFAAIACPFLVRPHARRRENSLPEETVGLDEGPGIALKRNPGVTLVWVIEGQPKVFSDGKGEYLFDLDRPYALYWYAQGREANRAEVMESVESGLPALQELADEQGDGAPEELDRRVRTFEQLLAPAA